jgi:hypothetical protein
MTPDTANTLIVIIILTAIAIVLFLGCVWLGDPDVRGPDDGDF